MSYTPTTEQVRSFWASDGAHQPAAKSYDHIESAEEFDRWFASAKAEVLRQESWSLIDWDVIHGHEPETPRTEESHRIAEWLQRRADQIEREAPDA